MNENHLHQIFENYIKKFEEINNTEHQEYYKWQIAKIFRPMMDDALKSEDAEFIRKLKQIRKKTENFIDSYTQPFGGLIRFADKWGCLVMTAEICKSGKRKSKHFWNKAIS